MANTLLKMGGSNPLTDAFGYRPRLGSVIDLNDGVTFTLATPQGSTSPRRRADRLRCDGDGGRALAALRGQHAGRQLGDPGEDGGRYAEPRVWTKSAALGASAVTKLTVAEYDASGALLRTDNSRTAPSATGSQASWTQLSGSYATGTSCAYVDLALGVVDATSGSAGGAVWFFSAQIWDMTATGAASMPYCELRFPQAPAQLLLTELLGDLSAPAEIAFGSYLASWPAGCSPTFALGRRATSDANAQLAGATIGGFGPAFSPQNMAALEAGSYGGYYVTTTVSGGWNPRAFSPKAGDELGAYHLWGRFLTKQPAGNLGNVQVRAVTVQQGSPWFGKLNQSDYYG